MSPGCVNAPHSLAEFFPANGLCSQENVNVQLPQFCAAKVLPFPPHTAVPVPGRSYARFPPLFLFSFAAAGTSRAAPNNSRPLDSPACEPMPEHPEPGRNYQPAGKGHANNPAVLVARKDCGKPPINFWSKVQEFRAKLDGTHTADVFSAICTNRRRILEKLAKLLKNRARPLVWQRNRNKKGARRSERLAERDEIIVRN